MSETNVEGRAALGIDQIVVDPLFEQVQNRKKEFLLTGIVEGSAVIDINNFKVDFGMS